MKHQSKKCHFQFDDPHLAWGFGSLCYFASSWSSCYDLSFIFRIISSLRSDCPLTVELRCLQPFSFRRAIRLHWTWFRIISRPQALQILAQQSSLLAVQISKGAPPRTNNIHRSSIKTVALLLTRLMLRHFHS